MGFCKYLWTTAIVRICFFLLSLFVLLCSIVLPARAAGPLSGYPHCYLIDTFPFTISVPGIYCLAHKIIEYPLTSSTLITINSDHVVLDLNGSTLSGHQVRFRGISYAVRSVDNKNVVVRNGTITEFSVGVSLTHFHGGTTQDSQISHGLKAEDLRLYRNKYIGLQVEGNGSEVRKNQIIGLGGFPDQGSFTSSYAIFTSGQNGRIIDNDISDIKPNSKTGNSYAIFINHPTITASLMAANNRMSAVKQGIFTPGGAATNWGAYRDNITINVSVPYVGGTDIGNNN